MSKELINQRCPGCNGHDRRGVVQLMPERDGGVYHYLEASARNLTKKRATYKCTIITINVISPLPE